MSKDITHHIITYKRVFIVLLVLTLITVGVSYVNFSYIWLGLFVGLVIACIKGYLVVSEFMHLKNEKSFIYGTLLLTVILFFVLLFIPLSWNLNSKDVTTKRNNAFDEYQNIEHNDHGDHHHKIGH